MVFLFVGGPGYRSSRSLHASWDLGHIAAFSLWCHLLLRLEPFRHASRRRQWEIVISFCLLFGGATEAVQRVSGGDASVGDLLRDLVGGVVTMAWFAPTGSATTRKPFPGTRFLAWVLLSLSGFPLARALTDEAIARHQFPILADFETPFEADRWEGGAHASVDRSVARNGRSSFRVDLDTSQYSGVFLNHFPGDWSGYRFLALEVLNPGPDEIGITCRVHDRIHEDRGRPYEDRFNKGIILSPGWNSIRIDLEEVARAPDGRVMDLRQVRSFGLFTVRSREKRTIFIDFVRLE